jgi:hypothetical protein
MCKAFGQHSNLVAVFSVARERHFHETGQFRAGASEMLMAFPIILHLSLTIIQPRGLLPDQISSFEALGAILLWVRRGKEGKPEPRELAAAARQHAKAFSKAYPATEGKPKNHFLHHLPSQIERDGMVLDAFVGERKHQLVKFLATNVDNTVAFEKSVLLRSLAKQFTFLQADDCLKDGLENAQYYQDWNMHLSKTVFWRGTRACAGDVISIAGRVCIIEAAAGLGPALCLIVSRCSLVAKVFRAQRKIVSFYLQNWLNLNNYE